VDAFYFLMCLFKNADCIILKEKCHNIDDAEFNLDMTYKTINSVFCDFIYRFVTSVSMYSLTFI